MSCKKISMSNLEQIQLNPAQQTLNTKKSRKVPAFLREHEDYANLNLA